MRFVADKALVTTTSNCAMVCGFGLGWIASHPAAYSETSSDRLKKEGDKLSFGISLEWLLSNELIGIFYMLIFSKLCLSD
jgi:hypothetical protein